MPVPKSIAPQKPWIQAINEDFGAGIRKEIHFHLPTIPTAAGTTEQGIIVPEDGMLHSAELSFNEALAANDTNYIMVNMVNYGQDGLGTVGMLVATSENSTRLTTGGSPLIAKARRPLKLFPILAVLKVKAGDRIGVRVVGTGTLANTLTGGAVLVRFVP